MNRAVLRSIAAVLLGWLVTVGGYVVTMVVIALFDPEAFQPAVHHSVGYWLLTLSVSLIYSVVGGFVTGAIARRREIAHAIGLVVFGLLISEYLSRGHANTMSAPNWYWIAGYVLMPLSTILGGWLRMKQRILLSKGSERMIRAMDHSRLALALTVSFIAFVLVMFLGTLLGTLGLWKILQSFLGKDYYGPVLLPMFIMCIILASMLSRRIFRRILGVRPSLLNDGMADDGKEN